MMGKGGPGRIRGPTVDEKTKVRISKALQRNLQRQQAYGGATTVKRQVAGTASSVAFTPLQVIAQFHIFYFFKSYIYYLFRAWRLSIPKQPRRKSAKPTFDISQTLQHFSTSRHHCPDQAAVPSDDSFHLTLSVKFDDRLCARWNLLEQIIKKSSSMNELTEFFFNANFILH